MWKWSARCTGLEDKFEHFDKQFRCPFITAMTLVIAGMLFFGIGIALDKMFGLSQVLTR